MAFIIQEDGGEGARREETDSVSQGDGALEADEGLSQEALKLVCRSLVLDVLTYRLSAALFFISSIFVNVFSQPGLDKLYYFLLSIGLAVVMWVFANNASAKFESFVESIE